MDPKTGVTLVVSIFIAPLVVAIIGLIFARIGLSGKLEWEEYYLKRIELIEKILSLEPTIAKARPGGIDCSPLYEELADIVARVRLMSLRIEEQAQLDFYKQPLYKRFWKLPKPHGVGGWVASVIFYLYALCTLEYAAALVFVVKVFGVGLPAISIFMFIAISILIAWLGRHWAIRSATSAIILERARRQLLQKPGHQGS